MTTSPRPGPAALLLALGLLTACGASVGSRDAQDPRASNGATDAAAPPHDTHDPATSMLDPSTRDGSSASARSTADPGADPAAEPAAAAQPEVAVATLGAGCFWCVEAVYEQLDGVHSAVSGYMGGTVDNPTYEQVCSKTTGHVEVVQVKFDPEVISYDAVLAWFWQLHDPTTRDRQGADVGPQYRSVIFTHDEEQAAAARASLAKAQAGFDRPIVTDIRPAERFWVAESYHQEYYFQNRQQGYCRAVIAPKLDKLGLEK